MAKSSQSFGSIRIDTVPLKEVGRLLKDLDPVVFAHFKVGLGEIGDFVAEKAKENARSFPRLGGGTDRIEGSIKKKQSTVNIRIVAGGDDAPEAAPLENNGQGGSFRHPVFGDADNWVSQTAHPFLAPAVDDAETDIEERLSAVIDSSLREVGFDTD
jgi:hypothetical protein